jgi:hypothetical protein
MPTYADHLGQRLLTVESRLQAAQTEVADLRGQVGRLTADRERLRARVIRAASGTVCMKCGGEVQQEPPPHQVVMGER